MFSIALVDKGLLPSLILLIILVMFGIAGARNLSDLTTPDPEKRVRQTEASHAFELSDAQQEVATGKKPHSENAQTDESPELKDGAEHTS